MSTTIDYIEFVCDQLHGVGNVRSKKMFGEYMVYVDERPLLLVCDNTVYVKKLDVLADLMCDADCGYPYEGAKENYILDIEDGTLTRDVIAILLKVTPQKSIKK